MTTSPEPIKVGHILRDPVLLLAHGLGSGLVPRAPGTFGTLAAVLPWLLLAQLSALAYGCFVVISLIAGVWLCGEAARRMQAEDPGGIVWDEWVGLWVALAGLPLEWPWLLAGFLLFRLFDVLKPWPVGWIDRRFHGGLGIMLDDIVAGAMAACCLHIALFLFHG